MSALINLQSYINEHGFSSTVTTDARGLLTLAIEIPYSGILQCGVFVVHARTYSEVRAALGY